MYRHLTPFLKSINTSLSSCSLRDGTISFIKYAPRILLLRVFTGLLVSIYQINSCSMFLAKCFAGSEFLLTSLCSSHLVLQFLIVLPTCVSPHEQMPLKITQLKCWILSFNGNSDWILRVFQTTLNFTFSLVKETNFLIKYAQYFSNYRQHWQRPETFPRFSLS